MSNVLNTIFTGKWAIETNYLDLIIGIASRTYSDVDAVLATPTERRQSGHVNTRNGVAVINVFGPIFPRADIFTEISGATSVETLALRFGEAIKAPDIRAIILNVDSPGGNIVGVNELSNMIYEARGKKPIIAYTGGLCASAAYWIASAADKIIADKTAFIGSIGVVAAWTDDSKARENEGLVDYEVVSSQSPDKRQDLNSKEGRAKLQAELDSLADIFIAAVARNRGTSSNVVSDKYGKGGVLISDDAVNVGMADALGSLENIIIDIQSSINNNITKGAIMSSMKKEDEEKKKDATPKGMDEEEDENEEEVDEEEEASTEKQKSALLSKNPALFNAIKQVGIIEERERIKAIDEVRESVGYSDLVKSAMFSKPVTAAELALQIVKADKSAIATAKANYEADAKVIGDVPYSVIDNNNPQKAKEGKVVDSIISGMKAAGGKEVTNV